MSFRALYKAGIYAGFFFSVLAQATTFGPISIVEQAKNTQYFVHGQVIGNSWVEMDDHTKRPYTFWKLRVLEQPLGNPLSSEITMRQPGGEIGGLGYQVAGSANFSPNEEVFVALRDTNFRDTKEVVGLSSGKYTVDQKQGTVVSGLGMAVTGSDGRFLSSAEFSKILKRVAQNQETDADRNIFVNRTPVHDKETELDPAARAQLEKMAKDLSRETGKKAEHAAAEKNDKLANQSSPQAPKAAQETTQEAEEKSKGSSVVAWYIAGAVLVAFIFALIALLRR